MINEEQVNALKGGEGELRMTVHVTRKATGLTETYELVGTAVKEESDLKVGLTSNDDAASC